MMTENVNGRISQRCTHQNYIEFDDRAEGIKHAIDIAEPGDTVVLASKGREPISNHARAY